QEGEKVRLVPYRKKFVHKYHGWMKDAKLQVTSSNFLIAELTASEPLSLQEEYEMQISWRDDPAKCTAIVLDRGIDDGGDDVASMAGDVNLFFNVEDDPTNCEIEIMIAEERCRRRGLATEALQMMMRFAVERLQVARFYCKIGDGNEASMSLFRRLGYTVCNYVPAFKETELELCVTEATRGAIVAV
ncbi:unnamed protein product, partial [Phaeothamnion confervicola]